MAGTLEIPSIGSPNSTEDSKIKKAIEVLNELFNSENKFPTSSLSQSKLTWYDPKTINTEETRASAEFGFLTTEDKIPGVVVREGAVVFVGYSAQWKNSVSGGARIGLFLGENQAKGPGGSVLVETAGVNSTTNFLKVVTAGGTPGFTSGSEAAWSNTGESVGNLFLPIFRLTPGTYTVGVKVKATSGNVTAKERLLQVYTLG